MHEDRAVDLRRHEARHEMDAFDRHRPALVQGAVDRGLDSDEHAPRLLQEPGLHGPFGTAGLEARDVHRRHLRPREVRADGLADEVGRGDARDPQPVRGFGRDRRLARAGRASDEQHDRHVEGAQRGEPPHPEHDLAALGLAQQLDGDLLEPVELDGAASHADEVELEARRQLVGRVHRDAGGEQRAGHHPLRVREPGGLAERERVTIVRLHQALTASGARARSASSSPGATTSLAASTIRRPRASASSATRSIAAPLSSVR